MSGLDKDPALDAINISLPVDKRMWREDLDGSIAHARMLGMCQILGLYEVETIVKGLEQVREEIERGEFPFRDELEDIHQNIERRLIELVGPVGGKLHTGRSRNDQVATDIKLWLKRALPDLERDIRALALTLMDSAQQELDAGTVMPFYTHLQRAQPVLLAHHLLAYVEMIERDRDRLRDALKRLDELPLGAAAGAGSGWPIDPSVSAELLGFARPCRNSLDAVSSRDYALEVLSALSILATNLSRLADELVLWSTREFGFVRLSAKVTTGSSIMPQKRNPDAAELVRAKASRLIGLYAALGGIVKGLPLAYNKDLQEAKEMLFIGVDDTRLSVRAVEACLREATFDRRRMRAAVEEPGGYVNATELADYLAQHGVPFREAHGSVRALVDMASNRGVTLENLPFEAFFAISSSFEPDAIECLKTDNAIARRAAIGGTAPDRVREALAAARGRW